MEPPQEQSSPDPNGLSFTTKSGCLFVFDVISAELLVFGARGSELALSLADLREIANEFREGRSFDELRRILLSDAQTHDPDPGSPQESMQHQANCRRP